MVAQPSTTPDPSLPKEGNYLAILMPGGEPKDYSICAAMKMAPLLRRRRQWRVVTQPSTTPDPSLSKEGNYGAILMPSGEPKGHAICAQGRL